jgi:hypothetical protein
MWARLLARIDPAIEPPVPALRIAGALFLIIYLLGSLVATRALMVTMRPLAMYASKSF